MTIASTLQHLARRSPASERNRGPILERLLQLLPDAGNALEIASGTGQHVAHFAARMPRWVWQPSDCTDEGFASIDAWCAQEAVSNVHAPVLLDATAPRWPAEGPAFDAASQDLVLCINMLHIAPWAACTGLMQGAARCLAPLGSLVTYGPYLQADVPTAPSNLAFDADLRARDPAWGLRTLAAVSAEAGAAGLRLVERHAMPANNLLLVFQRA